MLRRFPSGTQLTESVFQQRAADLRGHFLLVSRAALKKRSIEIIIQRDIEAVHPDARFAALTAVIVPIPGRIDGEIAALQIHLVALHSAVSAAPIDDEAHCLRRVPVRRRYFAPVQPLDGRPQRRRRIRHTAQAGIAQRQHSAVAAALERHEFARALSQRINLGPLPDPRQRFRMRLRWKKGALRCPQRLQMAAVHFAIQLGKFRFC